MRLERLSAEQRQLKPLTLQTRLTLYFSFIIPIVGAIWLLILKLQGFQVFGEPAHGSAPLRDESELAAPSPARGDGNAAAESASAAPAMPEVASAPAVPEVASKPVKLEAASVPVLPVQDEKKAEEAVAASIPVVDLEMETDKSSRGTKFFQAAPTDPRKRSKKERDAVKQALADEFGAGRGRAGMGPVESND